METNILNLIENIVEKDDINKGKIKIAISNGNPIYITMEEFLKDINYGK